MNPRNGVLSVDSISDQGIGLRFYEQGITAVDFNVGADQITRYFASLDSDISRPVILASVDDNQCSFAYFPANSSGCAVATSGSVVKSENSTTSSVLVSSSSGGNGGAGGSNNQQGTPGQDGISVINNNGIIRFGDDISIADCEIQEANGVPVINLSR